MPRIVAGPEYPNRNKEESALKEPRRLLILSELESFYLKQLHKPLLKNVMLEKKGHR